MLTKLIEKVVRDGIASVRENETRPERIRGGVLGFEMCLPLASLIEFETLLAERHLREKVLRSTLRVSPSEYWEYRYATIQVEFVAEVVKVHEHYKAFTLGQDHPPFSARAMKRYQHLMAN